MLPAAVPDGGPDASGWEDPPRAALGTAVPVLAVAGFEGPLDWLVEMARTRRIDLAQLSILALVDAFGAAMAAALARQSTDGTAFDLPRWGDWTVMAAQLAELRSRLLLPADTPGNRRAQADAEALRRRLLSRAEIGAVADWLQRRPQLGRDVFARGRPDSGLEILTAEEAGRPMRVQGGRGDITELLRACLVALRLPEGAGSGRPRPIPLWTVTQAIARVQQQIGSMPDGGALEVFLPRIAADAPDRALRCKAALASTLLAGLELARNGAVTLEQDQPWQPIRVSQAARGFDQTDVQ
jgi:segregation and condensation protein A